jgi:glucosamine-phosphate N-acetyltransferase
VNPVLVSNSAPAAFDAALLEIREMTPEDLEKGFLEALTALTDVGLSREEAEPLFHERQAAGVRTYVACRDGEVLGTASLLVERKFLHRGGLVGHIEDVAVRRDLQLKGIGTALVRHATEEACRAGCYKVILNCLTDRVPFYERLGYHEHDHGMRFDCA